VSAVDPKDAIVGWLRYDVLGHTQKSGTFPPKSFFPPNPFPSRSFLLDLLTRQGKEKWTARNGDGVGGREGRRKTKGGIAWWGRECFGCIGTQALGRRSGGRTRSDAQKLTGEMLGGRVAIGVMHSAGAGKTALVTKERVGWGEGWQ